MFRRTPNFLPKRGRATLLVLVMLSAIGAVPCSAIDIEVTGEWNPTVDDPDLSGGPGTDFNAKVSISQVYIKVTGANSPWNLYVRRSDPWPSSIGLEIRREDLVGATWIAIAATDTPLLTDRSESSYDLYCSLRFLPSVTAGYGKFETKLTYTVEEH